MSQVVVVAVVQYTLYAKLRCGVTDKVDEK